MNAPCYPGSVVPVRRGDLVRSLDDAEPSRVSFVISTRDFDDPDSPANAWFIEECREGIMLETPGAGRVLETEDCRNVTLIRSAEATPR